MLKITKKNNLWITMLLLLPLLSLCPCSCRANSTNYEIDPAPFYSSMHHWYDIYDKSNIIDPKPDQPRYSTSQITEIADNILIYQKDNGGWPKNYDMQAILTDEQKDLLIKAKSKLDTTFDNSTTYSHIECLAKVYEATGIEKYKTACLKGIDFTLAAQYPSGGWPQYFPLQENYSRHITFNDDAMVGIMQMLKDMTDNKSHYTFLDAQVRQKVTDAYQKGLDCILKCQIKDNGKLTAWCQQHDATDLSPAKARAYELPSICNRESASIVLFLMSLDNPSKEVINSIESAVQWFEDSKITGIRIEYFETPPFKTPLRILTTDVRVVEDPTASPIWARFYELKTHRPLFSNRQSDVFYSLAEVDRERRAYGWYTDLPKTVMMQYPKWQKKWAPDQNLVKQLMTP